MFSLLTILLLASSSVLAFETCDECLENIVAFGNLVHDHKVKKLDLGNVVEKEYKTR
jgi:hypothetical protein